jgi:hypothetical protein
MDSDSGRFDLFIYSQQKISFICSFEGVLRNRLLTSESDISNSLTEFSIDCFKIVQLYIDNHMGFSGVFDLFC